MSSRGLIAIATLAGVAVLALITLWPAHSERSASASKAPHSNMSWNRAAALDTSTSSPQVPGANADIGGDNPSDSPGDKASLAAPAPQSQAVTMQDGTVIWAAERERAGSTPAREH